MKINDNYIILNVIEVQQLQNGFVFAGKIKYKELNQIFKLTERPESIHDPIGNATIEFSKDDKEFQRQLSHGKLKEIQKYLRYEMSNMDKNKSLGMFPSSLILYNRSFEIDDLHVDVRRKESFNLSEDIINKSYSPELDCCFYIRQNNDFYKLYLPRNSKITLIVDGQHRFVGTNMLFNSLKSDSDKKLLEDFEFIMTFLVGFDIYEIGQIFATVNFNQKPVNRSLYYDIFGSAPQTDREGNLQNDIRLAHDLTLHLNNNDSSPVKDMIKLLGKGYGLFSQAFFVENMLMIFRGKIWDRYLIDYINDGTEYKNIAVFLKDYLNAIKEAFPSSWPSKVNRHNKNVYSSYAYDYILCKTTGLGAFFRLIIDIYPIVSKNGNLKLSLLKIFNQISDEDAASLFSKDGVYGGSGSLGLQAKLYKDLKDKFKLDGNI